LENGLKGTVEWDEPWLLAGALLSVTQDISKPPGVKEERQDPWGFVIQSSYLLQGSVKLMRYTPVYKIAH